MKTFDHPQRSPEWFELRRGLPTCSVFDKIVTPSKGEPSSSQDKLINELIAESLCPSMDPGGGYQSADMEIGARTEAEARAFYEFAHAQGPITTPGFCLADCGRFGGSPDALVGEDGGLEIKCPSATTQIAYIRAGTIPNDYRCQIHGYLVVTGRKWWDFLSYHPDLPKFRVRQKRDAFTEKLAAEISAFCDRYNTVRVAFGLAKLGKGGGK